FHDYQQSVPSRSPLWASVCNLPLHLRIRPAIVIFNNTPTTDIYTLSLHDALPISPRRRRLLELLTLAGGPGAAPRPSLRRAAPGDRKSTRLNSSHVSISYAVFCLKKKKQ